MKYLVLGALFVVTPSVMADEQHDLEKLLEISAPAEPAPKAPSAIHSEPEAAAEPSAETPPTEPPAVPAAEEVAAPAVEEPVAEATAAPVPSPKMTHYKVWIWQENGDTLWRIAQKVYGDKDKWKLIYLANKDVIKDPNKIYPKQKLKIPPPDWQP